ncbi:hypothetical protein GUJ93_ZPchr0005g14575 [Zizania palustris]|uniref:Late embryogenesis abundant protein LEA-2 subgroup domain-containing protein n=1 Tax=Zizania palustris TaxID=103762 RepID=A0A8J5VQW5_ZIZPA|nr:hypothetical protein GUJ93_ZPchr0005g14575 [Zizania palustris]
MGLRKDKNALIFTVCGLCGLRLGAARAGPARAGAARGYSRRLRGRRAGCCWGRRARGLQGRGRCEAAAGGCGATRGDARAAVGGGARGVCKGEGGARLQHGLRGRRRGCSDGSVAEAARGLREVDWEIRKYSRAEKRPMVKPSVENASMAIGEPARSAWAAEDRNEPARPLALPSPSVHPEEARTAATGWRSMQRLRRRRRVLCCCGCCVTTLVIVVLVLVVLALTVFRVKDPRITMNGVWLTALRTGPDGGGGAASAVATNATLTADVSVKNPNIVAVRFSRSETDVYYEGQTISVAYVPAGEVGADRTVRMNVTLDLLGDRLMQVLNGSGLILGQEYDLRTHTEMNATVKVLGIYKKDIELRMNCTVILEVGGVADAASGVQSKGVNCAAIVS